MKKKKSPKPISTPPKRNALTRLRWWLKSPPWCRSFSSSSSPSPSSCPACSWGTLAQRTRTVSTSNVARKRVPLYEGITAAVPRHSLLPLSCTRAARVFYQLKQVCYQIFFRNIPRNILLFQFVKLLNLKAIISERYLFETFLWNRESHQIEIPLQSIYTNFKHP